MNLPSARTFRLEPDGAGVAVLTLDEPATLNALTTATYRELGVVMRALASEPSVRVLVMTGAGRAFCSGGNVRTLVAELAEATEAERRAHNELTSEVVRAMRAMPQPIVAAINGAAVGGGAALAIAADLRLCAKGAPIGFPFPRLGLCAGDMGVSWLLPRLIGLGRATEMLLTGQLVDADTAERWGLVHRVVAAENLLDEALSLAERLAAGPPLATAETKQLLDVFAERSLDEALAVEIDAQTRCMQTADFREGHAALLGRRPPRFEGR